jgi:hypothetical protein
MGRLSLEAPYKCVDVIGVYHHQNHVNMSRLYYEVAEPHGVKLYRPAEAALENRLAQGVSEE